MLGAAPHQGTEQHLRGDVRGAEVQDRDHVRLGQEVNQALNLVLEQKRPIRTDILLRQGFEASSALNPTLMTLPARFR